MSIYTYIYCEHLWVNDISHYQSTSSVPWMWRTIMITIFHECSLLLVPPRTQKTDVWDARKSATHKINSVLHMKRILSRLILFYFILLYIILFVHDDTVGGGETVEHDYLLLYIWWFEDALWLHCCLFLGWWTHQYPKLLNSRPTSTYIFKIILSLQIFLPPTCYMLIIIKNT